MSPVRTRAAASDRGTAQAPKHDLGSSHGSSQKAAKTDSRGDGKAESAASLSKSASKADTKDKQPSQKAEDNTAPEVVETGILNYFIRGRVEIEEPKSLDEIARGYLVMRPLPDDIDLSQRPLPKSLAARLLALPKKQLPRSTSDRFMAFVDETGMPYPELAEGFLAPREYATKTKGMRHVPSATPVGEGVYAIVRAQKETHFAYAATLPEEKREFQRDLGFRDRGSFIMSSKNPKFSGPASARLPSPPEYPKDILEEFGSHRWVPTKPEHLDYKNTQLLLIGQGEKPQLTTGDVEGQAKVEDEMEVLMEEDLKGMQHLSSNESEAIFADLHAKSEWFHNIPESFGKSSCV
ncbi:hypothetical protein ISF_01793 [Cordyceps fumosorosea ARSEF 2679]|uniref:BTB domain transcription factor n=1 Tax=Cordyceps fumosorosea (strain ARSEF 2679) TaxID=1081104 RepID=A0A162JMX3_CORFA|nr:hypothetical protein ISF_01793 [Cordyceps fumosorosea ARSEF 2679]OAA71242.1 hypothetical protein ISF_01793 [Cordyceps fumosorosea ARSEF 2679]